ncbi:MAG: M67 family metallopeptidase [Actinomycetota bacterium]
MTNAGENEIRFPRSLADEMAAHCLEGRPNEACGLIASRNGEVVHIYKMANASASPVRYALEPKEQLEVDRDLDDRGWEMGGIFHSHTRTEAYPSPTDVREARVDVPFVIVSLASEPATIRAFRILKESPSADRGEIEEMQVEVLG